MGFERFEGASSGGYIKDFRQLTPPLPDGTQLMCVTYLVLENGTWRYKSGFSKITTIGKATTVGAVKQQEKKNQAKEFSTIKVQDAKEDEWG